MATRNAAAAIGLAGQFGRAQEGAFADLIALPYTGDAAGVLDSVEGNEVRWPGVWSTARLCYWARARNLPCRARFSAL